MKSRRIWRTGLIALGILAGAWAFAALLLPVLWPFLIGLAVSLLAEKPVRLLQTRARFPRWLASGVCVLTLFVLLFGGAFFLCRLLCTGGGSGPAAAAAGRGARAAGFAVKGSAALACGKAAGWARQGAACGGGVVFSEWRGLRLEAL